MPLPEHHIEQILEHADNPRNRGPVPDAQVKATGGNPGCGDIVVMYLRIGAHGRIDKAGFDGSGCVVSQASASMLTERLHGTTLDGVLGMSFRDVAEDVGPNIVTTRARCATLALSTVKSGIERYLRQSSREHV